MFKRESSFFYLLILIACCFISCSKEDVDPLEGTWRMVNEQSYCSALDEMVFETRNSSVLEDNKATFLCSGEGAYIYTFYIWDNNNSAWKQKREKCFSFKKQGDGFLSPETGKFIEIAFSNSNSVLTLIEKDFISGLIYNGQDFSAKDCLPLDLLQEIYSDYIKKGGIVYTHKVNKYTYRRIESD